MYKYLFLFILVPSLAYGQLNNFKIKDPTNSKKDKCKKLNITFKKLPPEIRFSVFIDKRRIKVYFTSKKEFQKIFNKRTDGLAIDIIDKNQYKCGAPNQTMTNKIHKGHLLPPVYKKELLRKALNNDSPEVYIDMGVLPQHFNPENTECNLIVIQKKYACKNINNVNVNQNFWTLLEMGLYRDSIDSSINYDTITLSKNVKIKIPFEKNSSKIDRNSAKKGLDSLIKEGYQISKLKIIAYSSIEGLLANNISLQNKRVKNISKLIEKRVEIKIPYEMATFDNWRSFIKDIKHTKYSYLRNSSKNDILKQISLLANEPEMESILKKHRYGKVLMTIEKKIPTEHINSVDLIEFYNENIKKRKLNEALLAQKIMFDKIENGSYPKDYINKIKIPDDTAFSPLHNNSLVYNFRHSNSTLSEKVNLFEHLYLIAPDNKRILYNYTSLRLQSWKHMGLKESRKDISNLISKLHHMELEPSLLARLKINYNIILIDYLNKEQKYRSKNNALKQIYNLYNKLDLNDLELLSLAGYLNIYSQFEWSKKMLNKRAYSLNSDPLLKEFYIRLAITESHDEEKFLTLLKKFSKEENDLFCHLFDATSQGGFSFQLLDIPILKSAYCESCN